jgi:hypothetical protein
MMDEAKDVMADLKDDAIAEADIMMDDAKEKMGEMGEDVKQKLEDSMH